MRVSGSFFCGGGGGERIAPNVAVEPSRWRMLIFFSGFLFHGKRPVERLLQPKHLLMGEKSDFVACQWPVRSMSFVQRH